MPPGVIAQYINVDILLKAGSAGFAAVAIKGGYDRYMMRDMLNREQKARQHAEERLAEARQDADDARKELAEGREEAHQLMIEARQQLAEAQQQLAEARRQASAAQQQASAAIAQANQRADAAQNMFAELVGDFREERRQAEADRRQAEAERRQQAATQQAIMETMLQLLQRQVNGQRPAPMAATAATMPPGKVSNPYDYFRLHRNRHGHHAARYRPIRGYAAGAAPDRS